MHKPTFGMTCRCDPVLVRSAHKGLDPPACQPELGKQRERVDSLKLPRKNSQRTLFAYRLWISSLIASAGSLSKSRGSTLIVSCSCRETSER